MAHGITQSDSMFSVREMPWHGLGVVLDEAPGSIDEALAASGLEWGVKQRTIRVETDRPWKDDFGVFHPAETQRVDGWVANVREDNGAVLGIVTDDYKVVSNREAFAFLDALIGSDLHFETAGSLRGGRRVWVLARLPEWVEVGGDPTQTYVYVANSHDGTMSVTAAATPVRIVCANTLGLALRRSERGEAAQRTFRFRHVGDLAVKFDEARKVMEMAINYERQFRALGDLLATKRISDRQVGDVLTGLFPITDDMGGKAQRNRLDSTIAVRCIYDGETNTQGNSPGTAWCLLNAIGEYADWGRRRTAKTNQVARSFEDADLKQRGLELVMATVD